MPFRRSARPRTTMSARPSQKNLLFFTSATKRPIFIDEEIYDDTGKGCDEPRLVAMTEVRRREGRRAPADDHRDKRYGHELHAFSHGVAGGAERPDAI